MLKIGVLFRRHGIVLPHHGATDYEKFLKSWNFRNLS